jgi:hypothetical protein
MNDDEQKRLEEIVKDIGSMKIEPLERLDKVDEPFMPRNVVRDLPWPSHTPRPPVPSHNAIQTYTPKNEDVPRAGELSSKVFNDLTLRIITELQETVESQITDAVNRRSHAVMQMESLKAEIEKAFKEYEDTAKKHQEKVNSLAAKVRAKVEEDTKEMIALSNRLREFADSVNAAHEQFFKE